jgi:hypothetical protein
MRLNSYMFTFTIECVLKPCKYDTMFSCTSVDFHREFVKVDFAHMQ